MEEVRSLAVENNLIYTIRDNDCVIHERTSPTSDLVVKKAIPGRFPLVLCGNKTENTHSEFLIFCTRDGKGLVLVDNEKCGLFIELWRKDNCHEMIINALHGNETNVYTGGFDGKVKKWALNVDELKLIGEVDAGAVINSIVDGPKNGSIYVGGADGAVREIVFE